MRVGEMPVPENDGDLPPDPEERPSIAAPRKQRKPRVVSVPRVGHTAGKGSGPDEFNLTELGNALRLVKAHGWKIRYCHPSHEWFVWTGKNWTPDTTGEVTRLATDTIGGMLETAASLSGGDRSDLVAWALKSEKSATVRATLEQARHQHGVPVLREHWDADPWLLNTDSGVVRLRIDAAEHVPHAPELMQRKLAPVDYDPAAPAPRWERFLEEALPDPEVRAYVQRFIGYALTGVIRDHVLVVFWGEGGNGKSTFMDAIAHALGPYAVQLPKDAIMATHTERHLTALTMLDGARLAIASETRKGGTLDAAMVKSLTGGDRITANRMRENHYTFTPTHKLVLLTNPKPNIAHDDEGMWRRLHLVPWEVSFRGREDVGLAEALRAEAPGILQWAVEGCIAWQRLGCRLNPPAAVLAATEAYRGEQDPLGEFFAQCCEIHPQARVARRELRERYDRWARDNGVHHPLSAKAFTGRVRERLTSEFGANHKADGKVRTSGFGAPVDAWSGISLALVDAETFHGSA